MEKPVDGTAEKFIDNTIEKKPRLSQKAFYFIVYGILGAAIIVVGVLIYFKYYADKPKPQPQNYLYTFPREPHSSANPDIAWELNAGGSGEDTVKDVYFYNNNYYMFGTTTSFDFDFTNMEESGQNLFIAVADYTGKLFYTKVFGSSGNDEFVKARIFKDGFLVLANTDKGDTKYVLYYIKLGSYSITTKEYDSLLNISALDLYASQNSVAIVGYNLDKLINKGSFIVTVLDGDLNLSETFTVNRPASMRYLDIFPAANGYVLAAASREALNDFATLITLQKNSLPTYSDYKRTESYVPLSVTPDDKGGFIFLIGGQKPALALIKSDKTLYRAVDLPFEAGPLGGALIHDGKGITVICNYAAVSSAARYNYDLTALTPSPAGLGDLGRVIETAEYGKSLAVLSRTLDGENILVTVINTDTMAVIFKKNFGGPGLEKPATVFMDAGGVTFFGNSYGKGGDVKHNYGQSDVWYFRIGS